MKTQILITIEHSKPLPDITDVICQRVWPYGGGCITDMTAAIQEERAEPSSRNQCDGCAVGAHVNRWGNHCMPDGGLMACTAHRYQPAKSRDLSDGDMDAVITAIKELNDGDLGFHGFCDRIIALATTDADTIRVGNETFSKDRMREAIKAGRAQP